MILLYAPTISKKSHLDFMEAINVRHLESKIFSQVFFAACHSSSEFLGLAARTPFFTSIQRYSIGLRSGDYAGHINFVGSEPLFCFFDVCFGSLSCWKTHRNGISSSACYHTKAFKRLQTQQVASILPTILTRGPTAFHEKQPHSIRLRPPCLIVLEVYLLQYCIAVQEVVLRTVYLDLYRTAALFRLTTICCAGVRFVYEFFSLHFK